MKKISKILLVEDDWFLSIAYKEGLERNGFETIVARDGVGAMKKVRSKQVDLILLDLVLPRKDGFEVLQELKEDNKLKAIPVIILSNLGQNSEVRKGKERGAVDYLVKSNSSMVKVVQKVREHLKKRRRNDTKTFRFRRG